MRLASARPPRGGVGVAVSLICFSLVRNSALAQRHDSQQHGNNNTETLESGTVVCYGGVATIA
jgi:hypothetical protein